MDDKMNKSGSKFGWIFGNLFGYICIPGFAVFHIVKGHSLLATLLFFTYGIVLLYTTVIPPWRYPEIGFGKFMLGPIITLTILGVISWQSPLINVPGYGFGTFGTGLLICALFTWQYWNTNPFKQDIQQDTSAPDGTD